MPHPIKPILCAVLLYLLDSSFAEARPTARLIRPEKNARIPGLEFPTNKIAVSAEGKDSPYAECSVDFEPRDRSLLVEDNPLHVSRENDPRRRVALSFKIRLKGRSTPVRLVAIDSGGRIVTEKILIAYSDWREPMTPPPQEVATKPEPSPAAEPQPAPTLGRKNPEPEPAKVALKIVPFLWSLERTSTDAAAARARVVSPLGAGLFVSLHAFPKRSLEPYAYARLRWEALSDIPSVTLSPRSRFLSDFGFGLLVPFSRNRDFNAFAQLGYSDDSILRSPSTSELTLDRLGVKLLAVGTTVPVVKLGGVELALRLAVDRSLPQSGSGYEYQGAFGYAVAIDGLWRQDGLGWGLSLYARKERATTSFSTQDETELALEARLEL